MKKAARYSFLTVILMVFSALALTGCGGEKESPAGSGGQGGKDKAGGFPQKEITFIVPYSPGGGYDTVSRLIAPYMKKYLPNQVNVIVKNVPGGECKIGYMEMWKAKPDGYTIGIVNMPGAVTHQLLKTAEYDLNKFTWIGRITESVHVAALSPKSKYKTLDDLKKAPEVKASVVGLASTGGLGLVIMGKEMGFNMVPVPHNGSSEAIIAAVRGDVDITDFPYASLKQFLVDTKDLTPFVVFSNERLETLPDTPTAKEMGYPQLTKIIRADYVVAGTPGIPDETAKILREAFAKALQDPEFQQAMKKANWEVAPATPGETAEIVKEALDGYGKYKDIVAKYNK
ncbi:MAG: Bug family tripartite tricarboxylate transporter substrate binding protein [Bacillota bacterium]